MSCSLQRTGLRTDVGMACTVSPEARVFGRSVLLAVVSLQESSELDVAGISKRRREATPMLVIKVPRESPSRLLQYTQCCFNKLLFVSVSMWGNLNLSGSPLGVEAKSENVRKFKTSKLWKMMQMRSTEEERIKNGRRVSEAAAYNEAAWQVFGLSSVFSSNQSSLSTLSHYYFFRQNSAPYRCAKGNLQRVTSWRISFLAPAFTKMPTLSVIIIRCLHDNDIHTH